MQDGGGEPKNKNEPVPQGYIGHGFEGVFDAFRSGFSQGIDKGASLTVYYKGSLVASLWGGLLDEKPKRPWREDTLCFVYSISKLFSSLVVADLVERGLLNYDEKIATYWPEFGQNGKEGTTLGHLLSHTAGLTVADGNYELVWMKNRPDFLRQFLQKQTPQWKPGKETGYSLLIGGLYLDEIVRRVDPKGRGVSQYFDDEIAVPFGLDIHVGLPQMLYHRTTRLVWPQYSKEKLQEMMEQFTGNFDLHNKSLSQPLDWNSRCKLHDPEFASLPSPSTHGMGTTKAVATLASILSMGGQDQGKVLLKQHSINILQKPVAYGKDVLSGSKNTYGLGTMIIPARQGDKTWFLFGHTGLGGQAVWCDSHHQFGFAYCTNYMDPLTTFNDNRWKHLLEAVYTCIKHLEGNPQPVRLFATYEEFLQDLKDNMPRNKL